MRRLLRLAALALGLVPLSAQAADPTIYTLPNGLQLLVLEDHRAPVVVHMVWYRVGSADEPRGHSGIAHFLEHLLFQGTETLAPGELSKVVSANGGSDNAFTSWDYTAYFQRIAADRLELVMSMEADRMRNLKLTEEDVATERSVILEERNQRTDSDPGALFSEQMRAALYQNAPYNIPIIGWRHEMEQLSRQDAFDMYARFYAPNNAIVIVAGDVEPEAVKALAEKHYGPLKPTEGLTERTRPQEPPQLAERRLSMTDARVAQPYVIRNYLVPERDAGDQKTAAALTMLAELLGGNPATSVLGRKLQFDSQTAVYSSAFYSDVSYDDTVFSLIVVPAEGVTLAEAEAALDAAVAGFIEQGIDDGQWERIRMQLRAARIYADDDISSQARTWGAALTSGLTPADVLAWPDTLQAVTKDEVLDAARTWLDRRRSVTGWLMTPAQTEVMQ
jgi:zinc protease